MNNLLHFPRGTAPQAAYGSAIHSVLQRAHNHLRSTGKRKPVEDILNEFEKNLAGWHLSEADFQAYLQRGTDSLGVFLAKHYATFTPEQQVELNFAGQYSRVGEAVLTGAIDLFDTDEAAKTMVITDYKTGKPVANWKGSTDWEKIKLHKFRQQLMFYKLLVEHSRDYASYTVEKGCLQFVEPNARGELVNLELTFEPQELAAFARLVETVYGLITTLELPDASTYSADYKGVLAFENDLLTS
jgi:DNA helicase-2/ATP-dependent DNA helicase PcrA